MQNRQADKKSIRLAHHVTKLESRNPWGFRVAFYVCLALVACAPSGEADRRADDDAEQAAPYGHPDSVLFWTPEQQVAGYRNLDKIFPTRRIKAEPRHCCCLTPMPI